MAVHRLDLLAQAGAPADVFAVVIAVVVIVVAAVGVVLLNRVQVGRLRTEADHAARVLGRIGDAPAGAEIRFGARRRAGAGAEESAEVMQAEGMTAISRTARQEAEIYLQHHRLALQHHSAYQQASLWSGLVGFSVVLAGAVLTAVAGLDVGAVTAVAGIIPAAAGRLLFRQATVVGDRAAENLRALEDSVRRFSSLQAALAATAEISDRQTRNRMYEVIGKHLLFPEDELETLLEGAREPG